MAPPNASVLVAAVGNAWRRDEGFGIKVIESLKTQPLAPNVHIADWSFGTIPAFQRLRERSWQAVVFVSGTARGRPAGTLHRFTAPTELPCPDEIHGRIGDGVMGLVAVDNLVIIGRYYQALPEKVVLIEAEPAEEGWGTELSAPVAPLVPQAVRLIMEELSA